MQKTTLAGGSPLARDGQIRVLTGASGTRYGVGRKLGSESRWFSGSANSVEKVERLKFVQLTGGEPAEFLPHVRYNEGRISVGQR